MRKHKINTVISSNINLEEISSSRLKFTSIGGNEFKVTSDLSFFRCERASFIYRYIMKRARIDNVLGVCSNPCGYSCNK